MEIKDMTIADLKSAYDFVLIDLVDLKEKAKKENLSLDKIPAYKEVMEVVFNLYKELLNRTRLLK